VPSTASILAVWSPLYLETDAKVLVAQLNRAATDFLELSLLDGLHGFDL